ncbi:Golgi integral membrane protein 4 isoform X3 [Salmo trutta]|uniref:Golgi integral membrane protein 4 isoform X3 n=1 Tax=Salmo trutta TaxID=8032 RepID=UPI0011314E98|nr:Golgi integral membrane protein 4-like isoform X3 [Salmo trutta]
MGNGVCSRRQRRIFQSLLLITVVFGIIYGGMISYEMHKQLKRTEAMAAKYQQHQESLSAQLQVVYEHRSRLEKSLQKERVEHKKAKEDYLVYKLEAQQSLNKEKQDSSSRLNSLHGQHQMLKKQHEDLKKQHYDLQEQHQIQGEDHGKALNEHKVRFDKLQQTKEMEASKLKENVYNLREENRQLRKAHQDIHVQLQDARIVHKDLKAAHDQLALTLEDHKSALAAAQVQVDEFKHLKETLIRMPSLRHDQNPAHQQAQPAALLAKAHEQGPPLPQPAAALLAEPHIEAHTHEEDHGDTQSRLHLQEEVVGKPEFQSQPAGSHQAEKEGYGETERSRELAEGEAERRRELAEEEMEQAGQPQKLEEESEQPQEDEGLEAEHDQPDNNALNRQRRQPQQDPESDIHLVPETHLRQEAHVAQAQVERVKSAYEQQQVQQRLEAERAQRTKELQLRQEALQAQRTRELQLRQEALLAQRMSVQREREQRLRAQHEREEQQQHREEDRREQLLKEEQLRKKSDYENMNNDIVQGDEEPHIDDDEERDTHLEEEKQEEEDHRVPQLQMAVNPDQQEDNLDDQYPEEDEVQEDLAGGQKREEEPYNEEKGEHEEVKDQEVPAGKEGEHRKEGEINEEENYEEEEEEEVGVGRDKRPNRREM